MTFRVGQKVVCVDASNFRNPHLDFLTDGKHPQKGRIYTIRSFTPFGYFRLQEIVGKPHYWTHGYAEGGWLPSRFRPIVERKTDISFAHEILRKATNPVRTPAMSLHHLGTEP